MRTFIRHPSDVPIEIHQDDGMKMTEECLNNISSGGLSFRSETPVSEGAVIRIRIPLVRPVFEARGKVVWCRPESATYDIGIEFVETKDVFKIRMIEQICHIEHYKKEIFEKEGRVLTGREAALEWISKFAEAFQTETTK